MFESQCVVEFRNVDSSSRSKIQEKLLEISKSNQLYSVELVGLLEQYVTEQVENSWIDIDANFTLLRLYLIYNDRVNTSHCLKILIKFLMVAPESHFVGAVSLLPASIRENNDIRAVTQAGFLLKACRFEEFWASDLDFAQEIQGFRDAIRHYIKFVVEQSHSRIRLPVLRTMLNVSEKEMQALMSAENWICEDDLIRIPGNEENQKRPKRFHEKIECEDVYKLIYTVVK